MYTMLTVPLTIWDTLESGGISVRYTRHYVYAGEFSLPLFINPKPNLITPHSIQRAERTKEKVQMTVIFLLQPN